MWTNSVWARTREPTTPDPHAGGQHFCIGVELQSVRDDSQEYLDREDDGIPKGAGGSCTRGSGKGPYSDIALRRAI